MARLGLFRKWAKGHGGLLALCRAALVNLMQEPPSPCNKICRIAAETGLCEGCGRSMAEITAWQSLSPQAKQEVLDRLTSAKQA
jgi:predicted Fe-S protein YdhL (DUF1289 family)